MREQWEPVESIRVSCQLFTRCKPFIMSGCLSFYLPLLFLLLYSSPLLPYKSRILREFSSVMNKKWGFYLWILPVVSELAAALGFLWAFSQRRPRHDYCYSEKGGGIWQRRAWSVERSWQKWHGEHISHLPRSDCKFPVLHFWLETHLKHLFMITLTAYKRKKSGEREKKKESSKNEVQNMTKCTELTLDLTNVFFFFFFKSAIFPTLNKSEMCWV